MEYNKLDYCSFEQTFVNYCDGCVLTDRAALKITAQDVDRFILLPSVMNNEEIQKYLGVDYENITKDDLNKMRKGKISKAYINALFNKPKASSIVKNYFLEKVPYAVKGDRRLELINHLWKIIENDVCIKGKRLEYFHNLKEAANAEYKYNKIQVPEEEETHESFCLFLAEAFVYAMKRDKIIENDLDLSPIVRKVVKDYYSGNYLYLYDLLEIMANSLFPDGPDENGNYVLESFPTQFTDDEYCVIASCTDAIADSVPEEWKTIIDVINMYAFTIHMKRGAQNS